MPTWVIGGLMLCIYTRNERGHRPHVHVKGNSGEVIFYLDQIAVRQNRGMKSNEVRRARRIVTAHKDELLGLWRYYHGD